MTPTNRPLRCFLTASLALTIFACGDDDDDGAVVDAMATIDTSVPPIDAPDEPDALVSIDAAPPIDADPTLPDAVPPPDAPPPPPDAEPNQAPVASFTMNPGCTSSPTDPITFMSTSTDPDLDVLSCSWVFSSGSPSTSTACMVTGVTFPHASPYAIELTVDDGKGGVDTTTMFICPCSQQC